MPEMRLRFSMNTARMRLLARELYAHRTAVMTARTAESFQLMGCENRKRAHYLDAADDGVLRAVVGRLADVKEVGDHAAHEVAGVVPVKVGEAEALVLVKQVLAHGGSPCARP